MHYLVIVIVDEPTEEKLTIAMEPFEGQHWDWYRPGGRWDGLLGGEEEMNRRSRDNGFNFSKENEQISQNCLRTTEWPDRTPYAFVTDEQWVSREYWDDEAPPPDWAPSTKGNMVEDPDYETKFRSALATHPDSWVIVVDVHN